MTKIVVVTSGKGGVGKTTTSASFASGLALRGKAIAGARGNGDARIFAMGMDPELISIAGIYRTSDTPLPASVLGKAAQVRLVPGPDGDKLVIEPLNP